MRTLSTDAFNNINYNGLEAILMFRLQNAMYHTGHHTIQNYFPKLHFPSRLKME